MIEKAKQKMFSYLKIVYTPVPGLDHSTKQYPSVHNFYMFFSLLDFKVNTYLKNKNQSSIQSLLTLLPLLNNWGKKVLFILNIQGRKYSTKQDAVVDNLWTSGYKTQFFFFEMQRFRLSIDRLHENICFNLN